MKEDLLKIIKHYGIMPQLKHIHSEYFELDEAITVHQLNEYYNEEYDMEYELNKEHIAEEISDVMVMLKQFQYYYGIEDKQIEDIMKFKIERQLRRIEEEK